MAQRDRKPVTCRGGGLTTEGESVTARGVLLDLKGLNRLLDCDGHTAWVEAGMTWHHVAEALRPRGLDYTSAPLNMLSTVGGTLGVGGIDVNSPRHGCSADQAVELEVVTPTGEIVRVKEGDDYLERVLLGYGQFGVITKARIKVRPYRPMAVRHFLYTDIGVALSDMMRLVEQDAVDACAILTLRDDVIALILGFEDEPAKLDDLQLRHTPEPWSSPRWGHVRVACRGGGVILFSSCGGKANLLPAHDPLFVRGTGRSRHARSSSALIWRYWGGPQLLILTSRSRKRTSRPRPGEASTSARSTFLFTLYAVMIPEVRETVRGTR